MKPCSPFSFFPWCNARLECFVRPLPIRERGNAVKKKEKPPFRRNRGLSPVPIQTKRAAHQRSEPSSGSVALRAPGYVHVVLASTGSIRAQTALLAAAARLETQSETRRAVTAFTLPGAAPGDDIPRLMTLLYKGTLDPLGVKY